MNNLEVIGENREDTIDIYANRGSDVFSSIVLTTKLLGSEEKCDDISHLNNLNLKSSINKSNCKIIKEFDLDEAIIKCGDFHKYQIFNLTFLSLVWILIPAIPIMLPYFRMIPEYYIQDSNNNYLGNHNNNIFRLATISEICDNSILKMKHEGYQLVTWASNFDLICSKNYYFGIMGSLYFTGILVGNFFISNFTDNFGRKKVIIFLLFLYFLITLLTIFAWNYYVLFFSLFIVGVIYSGTSLCAFVLNFESSSKIRRKAFSVILSMTYGLGAIFHILIFYYFKNWKISIFIMSLLTIIAIYLVSTINESPEYLIEKKDYLKLRKVLINIAKINNKEGSLREYLDLTNFESLIDFHNKEDKDSEINNESMPNQYLSVSKTDRNNVTKAKNKTIKNQSSQIKAIKLKFNSSFNKTFGILELLKLKSQRSALFLMSLNWFFMTMIFYGLNLNITNFETEPYLTGILVYLSESIAQLLSLYFMENFGYKNTLIWSYFISSISFIAIDFLNIKKNFIIGMILIFISKLGISAVVSTNYTFTADLFDVKVRVASMSFCSLMSRFGGITGTLTIEVTKYAMMIFGILCFVSSFIALKVEKVEITNDNYSRIFTTPNDEENENKNINKHVNYNYVELEDDADKYNSL